MSYNFQDHWNKAYQKTPISSLGWFEKTATPTLDLIKMCNLNNDAKIFSAGAGATTLVQNLINNGYKNIVVNDISYNALNELKKGLNPNEVSQIEFIVDDLTKPTELLKLENVDLWNDRAVLHFFTEESQQKAYFNLIKKTVRKDGYVILAEFNLDGAKKCCGLDIFNYNEAMLQERLGEDFELLNTFNYNYTQPSGNIRPYVYTLFKRKNC